MEFILSHQDLKDPIPIEYLSHEDKYVTELRKVCSLIQKLRDPVPEGASDILRY